METSNNGILIEAAKSEFVADLERATKENPHKGMIALKRASYYLHSFAHTLSDDEFDGMCDKWTNKWDEVWNCTWGQTDLRDSMIAVLRLERLRESVEDLRRYAYEREYTSVWIDRYNLTMKKYDLLMECEDWCEEWSNLSVRAIRYAEIMRARHQDYIEYGRIHP